MRIFPDLESVEQAVGEELGASQWITIDQERVDQFAEATGDHQWIHVDVDRAERGPFGGTIAHGYLLVALIPMLIGEIYRIDSLTMRVNYGLNRVRFPAPLRVGSRVRAGATLRDLAPREQGVQVTVEVRLDGDQTDKPVCIAETVSLLVP